ncbi:mitogen-activated protein kinase binding protein 1 [Elysia marginata]|uniref:Mitogen-activated protein kinase binding protein 1 n=1 Tax=Elysia marginata TaxID=1093978 RepID=A0AAV4EPB3_9GAST|nr:mitogen-activated protein kinase binding protein 1 [Elysia marginata]
MVGQMNPPGRRNKWRRASSIDTQPPTQPDNPFMHQKTLDSQQIVLEHVLGLTVYSNSALASDPRSGVVAYPAGCALVLLDSVKNKQLGTLHAPRKSITAVSFSCDGRYVLTGESGLQPAVRIWDVSTMAELALLRGHSFGIKTVRFSPRMREIIVVGDAQDMMISVWAWPGKVMGSLNKFSGRQYNTHTLLTHLIYLFTVASWSNGRRSAFEPRGQGFESSFRQVDV